MAAMTGEEKGALLLKCLAPNVADRVLAQLKPERRERLRAQMNRVPLGAESQQILQELLQELEMALVEQKSAAVPAVLPIPSAATPAIQPKLTIARESAAPEAALPESLADAADPLDALAQLPAGRIAAVLADESPRTISLMLNYLDVGLASEIYKCLPAAVRSEASVVFAVQEMPSLEILRRIAQAVVRKSLQVNDAPQFPTGAVRLRKMADMLRRLEKPARLQVLEVLESHDAAAAAAIKELLYRFDDVIRIENRSMQKILMEVDTQSLATALRDVDAAIADKFLSNLSKRAKDNLQEEMELSQTVPKDQIEQAQKAIVAIIQRLDLAGELVMVD